MLNEGDGESRLHVMPSSDSDKEQPDMFPAISTPAAPDEEPVAEPYAKANGAMRPGSKRTIRNNRAMASVDSPSPRAPMRPVSEPVMSPDTDVRRYLSVASVARRYDVCVSTVWRWVKSRQFPTSVKISNGTTRWRIADLDGYDAGLGGGS